MHVIGSTTRPLGCSIVEERIVGSPPDVPSKRRHIDDEAVAWCRCPL